MSSRRKLPVFSTLAGGACLLSIWSMATHVDGPRGLDASTFRAADADADLLTDDIEWAMLTDPREPDSNGDGVGDFVAVVTHRDPRRVEDEVVIADGISGLPSSTVAEHAARLVVSIREEGGSSIVWANFLFRFAGGTIPELSAFEPWIDVGGVTIPIGDALVLPGEFVMSEPTPEGLLLRYSCPVATEDDFVALGDATFGMSVTLDGLSITTGVFLSSHVDRLTAFTPVGASDGVVVPLAQSVADDPFWAADRVCWMSVSVVSSSAAGSVCTITDATCRPGGSLRCPPTCTSSISHLIYVPDGLSTLTGGG